MDRKSEVIAQQYENFRALVSEDEDESTLKAVDVITGRYQLVEKIYGMII